MRYSLLSRFQGGSLGSLLGETLASRHQNVSIWSHIAIEITERLIQSGQLTREDLEQLSQKFQLGKTATSSETALATLPIILFFHESPSLLSENLRQAAAVWQHPSESLTELSVWGTAIALALRERLQASQFVSQLLHSLKPVESPLVQQLEQIQYCIAHGIGLSQLPRYCQPRYSALSKALYCFGFTPEDFCLSVKRAAQLDKAPLTAALTGVIAGVYNSLSGIPIGWRVGDRPLVQSSLHQTQRLFNAWSGAYAPETPIPPTAAIASVLVMQKRDTLKILSQE